MNIPLMKKNNIVTLLCSSIFLCSFADAEQLNLSASAASENIDRGVSISQKNPVLSFDLSYDFSDIFYVGGNLLSGKNKPAPILNRGGSIFAGLFFNIFDSQAIDLSITKKYFSGYFQKKWNYKSLDLTYHLNRKLSVDYSYSDDYYGRGFNSRYVSVNWLPELSKSTDLIFSVGSLAYSVNGQFYRNNNVEAGVGFNYSRWRFEMKYHQVTDGVAFIYQNKAAAESGVVFKINYSIY